MSFVTCYLSIFNFMICYNIYQSVLTVKRWILIWVCNDIEIPGVIPGHLNIYFTWHKPDFSNNESFFSPDKSIRAFERCDDIFVNEGKAYIHIDMVTTRPAWSQKVIWDISCNSRAPLQYTDCLSRYADFLSLSLQSLNWWGRIFFFIETVSARALMQFILQLEYNCWLTEIPPNIVPLHKTWQLHVLCRARVLIYQKYESIFVWKN